MNPANFDECARVLDHLEVGVILVDAGQCVIGWNRWMERRSEFLREEALGAELQELFPEIRGGRLQVAVANALSQRLASILSPGLNATPLRLYGSTREREADERLLQLIHVIPMGGSPNRCLVQIQDVTASVRRETLLRTQSAQARESSLRDALTGVGNRRRFNEALGTEFRRALRGGGWIGLLMIDIDHFKAYNDAHGHPAGDACLRCVAQALQEGLRDSGDLLARYGGEEFAAILPGTDAEQAAVVAERLRRRVAERTAALDAGGRTVSIGVAALRPSAGMGSDALLSAADMALYTAKSDGRDRVEICNLES